MVVFVLVGLGWRELGVMMLMIRRGNAKSRIRIN